MTKIPGLEKWMNKAETDVFFALLRRSLGTAESVTIPTADFSWDRVMFAFEQHALLGVVADTIMSLPEAERPNVGIQMKMLRRLAILGQTHEHFDQVVCTLFDALTSEGLHPVMLKGQGLAALYPKRHTRSCGDIDLYLHPEEFERGARIVFDLCGDDSDVAIKDYDMIHHLTCEYGDIHIEVHYLTGSSVYESNRKEYEQWLQEEFRKTDSVMIGGREIAVPHHHVNVIYVFSHLLCHLMGSGIGVRQFIDLMLLLKSQPADVKALERDLRRFHLLEPWQTVGGVLVYQLGMKQEDFPLWNAERAEILQGEYLDLIIAGGNLGQMKEGRDIYTKHDKFSLRGYLYAIAYRWRGWRFHYLQFLYHLVPYKNKQRAWDNLVFLSNIAIKRICKLKRN